MLARLWFWALILGSALAADISQMASLLNAIEAVKPVTKSAKKEVNIDKKYDRFERDYLERCNRSDVERSTIDYLFVDSADAVGVSWEDASREYLPRIVDTLFNEIFKNMLALRKNPDNLDAFQVIDGSAHTVVFVLYEAKEVCDNMPPSRAAVFLEVIYRFAPGSHRYDVVFRRLWNRVKGHQTFASVAKFLVEYFPFDYPNQFSSKVMKVDGANLPVLESLAEKLCEAIFTPENQKKNMLEPTYDLAFMISINKATPKLDSVIGRIDDEGYGFALLDSSLIMRNWERYLAAPVSPRILEIFRDRLLKLNRLAKIDFKIAFGGLATRLFTAKEVSEMEVELRMFTLDAMEVFSDYQSALQHIETLDKDINFKDKKSIKDKSFRSLIDSLKKIKCFSPQIVSLDPELFARLTGVCHGFIDAINSVAEDLKKSDQIFEGLQLSLHSLDILNDSSADDHSEQMIAFWDDASDLFHDLGYDINDAFESYLKVSQVKAISAVRELYPAWEAFTRRLMNFGLFEVDETDLEQLAEVFERFPEDSDKAKIEFAVNMMNACNDFSHFMAVDVPLIQKKIGADIGLAYNIYLLRKLNAFFETKDAHLKTFDHGRLLDFLRNISYCPERYVLSTLFRAAEMLFSRDLF